MISSPDPTTIHPPRNTGAITMTALPVAAEDLPPLPRKDDPCGSYQSILLDIKAGTVQFFCADWTEKAPRSTSPERAEYHARQFPGELLPRMPGFHQRVPELLRFTIDSGVEMRPYLTAAEGNALAEALVPLAQEFVDNLVPVHGTADLDWSAAAMGAIERIRWACSRYHKSPSDCVGFFAGVVDFEDAVAAVPELGQFATRWASYSDAALEFEVDGICLGATAKFPELLRCFPQRQGARPLEVAGVRAWAYLYRAAAAEGLTVMDATTWIADNPATVKDLGPDPDPDEITAWSRDLEAQALQQGVKLFGAAEASLAYRAECRRRVWDRLPAFGEKVARLERELARARTLRRARVAQVLAWGDPMYSKVAAVAGQSAMSRQAVHTINAELDAATAETGRKFENADRITLLALLDGAAQRVEAAQAQQGGDVAGAIQRRSLTIAQVLVAADYRPGLLLTRQEIAEAAGVTVAEVDAAPVGHVREQMNRDTHWDAARISLAPLSEKGMQILLGVQQPD